MNRQRELVRSLRAARALEGHERLGRDELDALVAGRVAVTLEAARRAPALRERVGAARELDAVPPITKAQLMQEWDRSVTVPGLTRDATLAALREDRELPGGLRAMTTSGSTGLPGLFVWGPEEWPQLVGGLLRASRWMGFAPRFPRRRRVGVVGPPGTRHMSSLLGETLDAGIFRVRSLPATAPLLQLCRELQAWAPDRVQGYPSIVARLAQEQLAGRLAIAPELVSVSSERCTPEMREVIRRAWGVEPFDQYAMTEAGFVAAECEHHRLHVFEDQVVLEPVEEGVLVTSLVARVQPIVRLLVTDVVVVGDEPCPCGRALRTLRAVEGRLDDVLEIGGATVHPLCFASLAGAPEVAEFQVVQRGGQVRLRVVPAAPGALPHARLEAGVRDALLQAGVPSPDVVVEEVAALPRDPASGKLKLVVAEGEPARAPQ